MKKHTIFKTFVLLMIVALLASSCCALASCNDSEETEEETPKERTQEEKETIFSIGVIADPQVIAAETIVSTSKEENLEFYHYSVESDATTKMLDISEAIFNSTVDDLIAKNVDVAFLIGDLSDTGGRTNETAVVAGCARLKAAGIPVFVANGICDTATTKWLTYLTNVYNSPALYANLPIDPAEFKEVFADYGYNQACFQDTNSISYAADIAGTDYRVLMLENTEGYDGNTVGLKQDTANPLTNEQMTWIESVLQDSQKKDKKVLVISSLPIEENPIPYYTAFMDDAYLTMDRGSELQTMFMRYGVKYVFSGHTHIGAENVKTDGNGNTLYEITTTSLAVYPSAYNIVEIKDDYTYLCTAQKLATLKEEYLPNYISAEDKAAVLSDYQAYVKNRFTSNFIAKRNQNIYLKGLNSHRDNPGKELVLNFLTSLNMYPAYVKDESGNPTDVIDEETTALYEQISHDVNDWMKDVNSLKLYGNGDTIQGILEPYNITMPASEFKNSTVLDFIMDVIYRMMEGTFILEENGTDVKLLTCIFYAGAKKFAGLELFDRLHALDEDVSDCDMNVVIDYFLSTGILDVKKEEFLVSVISLFFPYLRNSGNSALVAIYKGIRNLSDSASLLQNFNMFATIIATGIPDLYLFTNESGEFETDYISLKNGEVYVDALVAQILFPVIARTVIVL